VFGTATPQANEDKLAYGTEFNRQLRIVLQEEGIGIRPSCNAMGKAQLAMRNAFAPT
jgi:hypothetical protein